MQRRTVKPGAPNNGGNGTGGMSGKSVHRLKRLDIYGRPKQEFQKATTHGAVVSILLMATVVALTWREFSYSMRMETVESLFVNSTISPIVDVRFDVVFSRIACGFISLDAEDASGTPLEDLKHDVTRTRLDVDGRPIGGKEKHYTGNTLKAVIAQKEAEAKDTTGRIDGASASGETEECNCYGAGSDGECCRTCGDVEAAYRRKGWKMDASKIPVCANERGKAGRNPDGSSAMTKAQAAEENEGCRLAGSLQISSTEGSFHFAPGHQMHRRAKSMSYFDQVQVAMEKFNTTHTIQGLSFGHLPPFEHASSKHIAASTLLEGHHKTVQDTHAMHQYFLHVVPTVYRSPGGKTVHSNQYSATEHLKHVHSSTSRDLPGVYFRYEVSPVQALVETTRRGYLPFLTGACGVVGGVYTIFGLINRGIDSLLNGRGRHRSR